jgi:hypothetical protein
VSEYIEFVGVAAVRWKLASGFALIVGLSNIKDRELSHHAAAVSFMGVN